MKFLPRKKKKRFRRINGERVVLLHRKFSAGITPLEQRRLDFLGRELDKLLSRTPHERAGRKVLADLERRLKAIQGDNHGP